jgi:prepilin-type N-terminal cleavage/methylation domain-containing protein
VRNSRKCYFARSGGFTLVESVIVLVILSIAAVGIISMQGTIFSGQASDKNIQVGVQLMQECAELLLANRRTNGFSDASLASSSAATTACSGITLSSPSYAAPTVTITYGSSSTIAGCPSATANSCLTAAITQGGLTSITLMLGSY